MALFGGRRSASEEADETSRAYLASAPPGSRTEVLAAAPVLQTLALPIAATERFGEPVTVADLAPVTALVSRVMYQDHDLSGHIVRKITQHAHVCMTRYMTQSTYEQSHAAYVGAVGITADGTVQPRFDKSLSPAACGQATSLAGVAFAILRALVLQAECSAGDRKLYVEQFTGPSGDHPDSIAYQIIAWNALAIARMLNMSMISPGVPVYTPAFKEVPRMTTPGWYPNPNKMGLVNGEATFQRFWDGTAWTDRVRIREGRRWETSDVSLHTEPVD